MATRHSQAQGGGANATAQCCCVSPPSRLPCQQHYSAATCNAHPQGGPYKSGDHTNTNGTDIKTAIWFHFSSSFARQFFTFNFLQCFYFFTYTVYYTGLFRMSCFFCIFCTCVLLCCHFDVIKEYIYKIIIIIKSGYRELEGRRAESAPPNSKQSGNSVSSPVQCEAEPQRARSFSCLRWPFNGPKCCLFLHVVDSLSSSSLEVISIVFNWSC